MPGTTDAAISATTPRATERLSRIRILPCRWHMDELSTRGVSTLTRPDVVRAGRAATPLERSVGQLDALDRLALDRAIGSIGLDRLDRVDCIHAVGDAAEYGVLAVEPRRLGGGDDEELRAVRVRPRVGHRERAADDLVLVDLVLELVAGAAGAGALRAAALDHEVADDAMEREAVVVALLREVAHVADRLGSVVVEHLEDDVALVRGHGHLGHALILSRVQGAACGRAPRCRRPSRPLGPPDRSGPRTERTARAAARCGSPRRRGPWPRRRRSDRTRPVRRRGRRTRSACGSCRRR